MKSFCVGANKPDRDRSRDPDTPPRSPTTSMSAQIFEVNPYENHPELTQTEAELLWEYAKLNQRLKIVSVSDVPFRRIANSVSFTR